MSSASKFFQVSVPEKLVKILSVYIRRQCLLFPFKLIIESLQFLGCIYSLSKSNISIKFLQKNFK